MKEKPRFELSASVRVSHIMVQRVLQVPQISFIFRTGRLSLLPAEFQEITLVSYYAPQYPTVLSSSYGDPVGRNQSGFAPWQMRGLAVVEGHRSAAKWAGCRKDDNEEAWHGLFLAFFYCRSSFLFSPPFSASSSSSVAPSPTVVTWPGPSAGVRDPQGL